MVGEEPRYKIDAAAGRGGHDETYWTRRVRLSPSDARQGRETGGVRGQLQKLPAWKFHSDVPCRELKPVIVIVSSALFA